MARLPLKLEQISEKTIGQLIVRYPLALEAQADKAAEVMLALIPVVESYLAADLTGPIRLELLAEARASGANPVTGTVRHAITGFAERSPRSAGLLSYQLGRILWYRASAERDYLGEQPRYPDWLLEAALLPLLYIWFDREAWLDFLGAQITLFKFRSPLASDKLNDLSRLSAKERSLANAQCVLRGQSLARRQSEWWRGLCSLLAAAPQLDALVGLEQLSGASLKTWEDRFAQDLAAWVRSASSVDFEANSF